MISRRLFAAGLLLSASRPAAAAPARIDFEARRGDSLLGRHSVTFARAGDALEVSIAVDYRVSFGPLTLFRYSMRGRETWRGDTLRAARFETDDDGRHDTMVAERRGADLMIDGSKSGRYVAPPGALPASHWNRRELDGPMINPQNGELLPFTVRDLGMDEAPSGGGVPIAARHYSLTGPSVLDLWYDASGTWAGLRAVAPDGSVITYLRGPVAAE